MQFSDRSSAGHKLAEALRRFRNEDAVVLALPRGGVAVGAVVADELKKPFGIIQVRKIGHPAYPECAIGAIAEYGAAIYNDVEAAALDDDWLREAEAEARQLMAWRRNAYFDESYSPPEIEGRTAIIVDDGIATGLTMRAAVQSAHGKRPAKLIVAVPVASRDAVRSLKLLADELVILDDSLRDAVGAHYLNFPQVDDDEVKELLLERWNYDVRQTAAFHP